ncbi:uncharacterized protein LOC143831534 isoform X2 [Paroedura picta]|uniref:uncharacterized protein LOC143831534 isoform X2 n=1 Tax=Paroedura picta TaxID=143630 RepID=UPI0040561AD0
MEATGNHLAEAEDMHLNPQGDSRDPASEQGAPSGNGDLRRNQQNGYWCRFLHRTKASRNVGIIVGILVGILVSMALVGITVGITVVYLGKTNQSEGTPASTQEVMSASTPLLEVNSSCPDGSIQYEDCCYRFSESETKWNLSQDICSLYGGVPFVPRTPQELA